MLRLFIVHEDQEYIQLLTRYIADSEKWRSVFRCSIFTMQDTFIQAWEAEKEEAAILLSPKMLESLREQGVQNLESRRKVLLMDSGEESRETYLLKLLKYQSVEHILQQISDCYVSRIETVSMRPAVMNGEGPFVFSVSSASGASGKTLFSLQVMKLLQFHKVPALYVSLEPFSILRSIYRDRCDDQLDKLLYYFRAKKDKAVPYLEDCIINENGFSFLSPFPSAGSYEEMTSDDVLSLLEGMRELRQFAVVIVDTHGSGDAVSIKACEYADQVFWLLNQDAGSRLKLSMLFDQLKLREEDRHFNTKSYLLINRASSRPFDIPNQVRSLCRSVHPLPLVQEWEQADTIEVLLKPDKTYVSAVQSAVKPILQRYGLLSAEQEGYRGNA